MKKTRLLIGKTLLATLILLTLMMGLLTSRVFSFPGYDQPANAITANYGSTVITTPPFDTSLTLSTVNPSANYSFYAYVDVINVTSLGAYSIGFTFNYTYVQITNITDGGFLGSVSGATTTGVTGAGSSVITAANSVGEIDAVANAVEFNGADVPSPTGSGHLLKIGFKINPALTQAGGPVNVMHFNVSSYANYQCQVFSNDTTDITPAQSNVYDATLTISSVTPEFSSVFFATLLVSATLAAAVIGKIVLPRKRERLSGGKQNSNMPTLQA